jgi:hypothetical protein
VVDGRPLDKEDLTVQTEAAIMVRYGSILGIALVTLATGAAPLAAQHFQPPSVPSFHPTPSLPALGHMPSVPSFNPFPPPMTMPHQMMRFEQERLRERQRTEIRERLLRSQLEQIQTDFVRRETERQAREQPFQPGRNSQIGAAPANQVGAPFPLYGPVGMPLNPMGGWRDLNRALRIERQQYNAMVRWQQQQINMMMRNGAIGLVFGF